MVQGTPRACDAACHEAAASREEQTVCGRPCVVWGLLSKARLSRVSSRLRVEPCLLGWGWSPAAAYRERGAVIARTVRHEPARRLRVRWAAWQAAWKAARQVELQAA